MNRAGRVSSFKGTFARATTRKPAGVTQDRCNRPASFPPGPQNEDRPRYCLTHCSTQSPKAGRDLLRGEWKRMGNRQPSITTIDALCRELLSSKGEALGTALAQSAVGRLPADGRGPRAGILSAAAGGLRRIARGGGPGHRKLSGQPGPGTTAQPAPRLGAPPGRNCSGAMNMAPEG